MFNTTKPLSVSTLLAAFLVLTGCSGRDDGGTTNQTTGPGDTTPPTLLSLTPENGTARVPTNTPVVATFSEVGTYTVSGEYTHGNDTFSASIQVVAIDGAFPEEAPACLVGRERDWSFQGMPSNLVYEVDDTLKMEVSGVEMVEKVEEFPDGSLVTNQTSP